MIMTFYTDRFDLKWLGIVRVMSFFRLLTTICAFESTCTGKFPRFNSVCHNSFCFMQQWMIKLVPFSGFPAHLFALFALPIAFMICFALFSPSILTEVFQLATFTGTLMTVFFSFVFVELRNRFDLLALGTFFRYDCFSHIRFLSKRYRLEPFARPFLVCGSFYCISTKRFCQGEI